MEKPASKVCKLLGDDNAEHGKVASVGTVGGSVSHLDPYKGRPRTKASWNDSRFLGTALRQVLASFCI